MAQVASPEQAGTGAFATGAETVNGIRLAYRLWHGPDGGSHPPVVLLHGLLQTGDGMTNLAAHLARRGLVLVPDLRGRGASDQEAGDYRPATMADDVAALIAALGIDRPVVIGRLHGGLVAYQLAARYPTRIRGLVLGDTAPEVSEGRAERERALVRRLPASFGSLDEAVAFYQDILGLSVARARHDIPSDLAVAEDGRLHWRHNLALIARIEDAAAPRSDWEILSGIRCPTLLLRGQRGEVPKAMADRFCETIAGCQVQTILGARHDLFLGPGAEQAFGAIELFLMRLAEHGADARQGAAALDQLAIPLDPIERIVAAINGRDDAAIDALFAQDGRFRLLIPDEALAEGGPAAARAALWRLLDADPDAVVEAREAVIAEDGAAALLTVRNVAEDRDFLLLSIFMRLKDGRIDRLTVIVTRPGDQSR